MKNVYLIGNAHIDPVWLWRWQDGFSEVLATFRSALDRMKDFPDFKFASSCAVYYQWVEKMDPEMFSEIQQRVREGRWDIVGGWFLQPDCNIPCGESFARQALISQRYFKEKFGVIATCGYNVDSFGHNANLPQLLKKSGMENYIFMRPMPEEGEYKDTLFNWESADGSTVCAYRIPWYYAIDLTVMDTFGRIKEKAEHDGRDYMAFFGVGNHGGGPTIKLIDEINKLGIEGMIYSTPDEYFKTVDKSDLPTIKDELQHHARGCYSLGSFVKKNNRKCENNLLAAEKFCIMAEKLCGMEYPKKKLDKAWKNLMFNQFHDVLAGCIIKSAYEDASYLYGETMSITEQAINMAIQKIAWNIDTLQGETLPAYRERPTWTVWQHEVLGTPVIVFNPHAWSVCAPVKVYADGVKVIDANGKEIPFQLVRGEQTNVEDKYNTAFIAEVEPFGYAVYRLFTENAGSEQPNEFSVTERTIENSSVKIELDAETGDICGFYNKKNGEYIINSTCRAILLDETECDSWAHDKRELGEYAGEFRNPEFKIIEAGPVIATIRVITKFGKSSLQRDYSLILGSACVQVKTKVDFHEDHRTIKFAFPVTGDKIVSKIPFGSIERGFDTGEEPCGSWIACGKLGIANDSKHGYDAKNGTIRMSVLRSALYADHFAVRDDMCEFMEQGEHEFEYVLFPYTTPADAEKCAEEINFPLRTVIGTFHDGYLPEKMSCIGVSGDSAIVTAIKKREDSSENIVRLYEANGEDSRVKIKLFGKEIESCMSHNEIKTLTEQGEELNLIEW